MKRIASLLLSLVLLASSAALAASPGSSSDPLITRSYAEESILAPMAEQGASDVTGALAERYEAASAALDASYDSAVIRARGYSGYTLSKGYTPCTLRAGAEVTVLTGGSFVLTGGAARVNIVRGAVVNASTGNEVETGSSLNKNQRYFCAENTMAVFAAGESSTALTDGLFRVNEVGVSDLPFRDVAAGKWYVEAVRFVYGRGLFQGTSASTFAPDGPMTRAMFVTVLHRMAGEPQYGAGISFPDVQDTSQWYYAPVAWASGRGIVSGYEDGSFRPQNSVTREQMAVIIFNYVRAIGGDTSGGDLSAFPDGGSVSPWAREAMCWATAHGIINGSDGYLLPRNTATRAQVAQIVKNCIENLDL